MKDRELAQHRVLGPILLATDFSDAAGAALPYAIAIARRYGAKMYVVHVIPPVIHQLRPPRPVLVGYEQARQTAEAQMRELVARLKDVPHEALVLRGEVADVLSETVQQYGIGMMVLGTRGRRGLRRFMLGSVAEEIFRLAPCPVLTVGPKASTRFLTRAERRRILFPTDFTPESLAALPQALSLAREHHARLTLLHVAPQEPRRVLRREFKDPLVTALRGLVPPGTLTESSLEFIVRSGAPARAILRFAAERECDLIVLGVRGGGAYLRASTHLPGPTAYAVVATARCPVLTFHVDRVCASIPKKKERLMTA